MLSFTNCNGVTITGIKAGHSVTGDYMCDVGIDILDSAAAMENIV